MCWIWLFPLTYVAHLAEEYVGGFSGWLARTAGLQFPPAQLLVLNSIGIAMMALGAALVQCHPRWRWILTALAAIVLTNGITHVLATVLTRSYSPGMVTGGLLWIPLGIYTIRHEWLRARQSTFWKGLLAAAVVHVILIGVAYFAGQLRTG